MTPPMKTPRLRLRLVSGGEERFKAESFCGFEKGLADAADALGYRLYDQRGQLRGMYQNLHVAGRGEDRYFWIGGTLSVMASTVNAADTDPSKRLKYFPEYDLHLAVARHGTPRKWAYSTEGVWITCQKCWLWLRELDRFCETTIDTAFDMMKEEKEEKSGEYEVRNIRSEQKN